MKLTISNRFVPWLSWLVLLLSLSAAVWAYRAAESEVYHRSRSRFDARVQQIKTQIKDRIQIYEQVLLGARGLFAASQVVEPREWQAYIEAAKIYEKYPGISAVGFVRPADLSGFDRSTDSPQIRAAAELSRDRGAPTISAKITFQGDRGARTGFLFFVPVYRNGARIETAVERIAALEGWISARFDVRDIMKGVLGGGPQDMVFEIFDGIEMAPETLLYGSEDASPEDDAPSADHSIGRPVFVDASTVELGERVWMLNFQTTPNFEEAADRAAPTLVLIAGLLGSFLLFSITWSLVSTRRIALGQAERMTGELRSTQKELILARDAAQAANRAKSDFLTNMTHELRTPLNSLMGFANILQTDKTKKLADQQMAYLDRIVDNAKYLLGLINRVLDLAKVESGLMDLEVENLYLDEFVRDILDHLEGRVLGRGITLTADIPRPTAPLLTDVEKLRQILINLVGNAIKFTEKGGVTVRVSVEPESLYPTRIDVIDTGVGIPMDKQKRLFDAFRQVELTADPYKLGDGDIGTGLGLAISRSLCQILGYHIEVQSEVGKGSTFSVVIPPAARELAASIQQRRDAKRTAAVAPGPQPAAAGRKNFSGKHALVIDDDPDARILLSHCFEELGLNVRSAPSGERGMEMARERPPDVITVDLMMRHKNGREVLREIKSDPALRQIPVVVVSAVADENRASIPEAVRVLNKPVRTEDLESILLTCLGA